VIRGCIIVSFYILLASIRCSRYLWRIRSILFVLRPTHFRLPFPSFLASHSSSVDRLLTPHFSFSYIRYRWIRSARSDSSSQRHRRSSRCHSRRSTHRRPYPLRCSRPQRMFTHQWLDLPTLRRKFVMLQPWVFFSSLFSFEHQ
jgi:hypothetical protein